MLHCAPLLILASLLAMGCNNTRSAAQPESQTSTEAMVPAEQQTKPPEIAGSESGQGSKKTATPKALKAEKETRYLAFQIFTSYTRDPKDAQALSSTLSIWGGEKGNRVSFQPSVLTKERTSHAYPAA